MLSESPKQMEGQSGIKKQTYGYVNVDTLYIAIGWQHTDHLYYGLFRL